MFKKEELLKLSNELWDESRKEYKLNMNEDEYKDIMEYRQLHSKIVADLAIKMFDDHYENLFKSDECRRMELYFGCLTHDIKKIDEKHHKKGAKFIRSALELRGFNDNVIKNIFKIIKYHKSKSQKKKDFEYKQEVAKLDNEMKTLILFTRLADKLSKLVYKSNYKLITEKKIDEKLSEIKKNSYEFMWNKEELNKVFESIKITVMNKRFIYRSSL